MLRMVRRRAVEISEPSEEEPVLFLILGSGGIRVYSRLYSDIEIEEDIIGAFIAAFESFSGEMFNRTFDRAKLGEYVFLVSSEDPFVFVYIYKGQTYLAQQKLNKIASRLRDHNSFWDNLLVSTETHVLLKGMEKETLGKEIDAIILNQEC